MRTAICVDCGVEFECGSRGRKAERCPIHRPIRHQAMREAIEARRVERPCRHPDGCARPASKLGWCSMHDYRIKRYGEPGPAGNLTVSSDGRDLAGGRQRYQYEDGYIRVRVGRGPKALRYEHHVVMEQVLGRPLRLAEGEEVHHKNTIRDDNRPENLELWHTGQPSGGRVEDKVAWCIEFLERYAPEVLATKPTQLRLVA